MKVEMLELLNIQKHFGDNAVLRDFTLSLKRGKLVILKGSSAVGKTTILELIAGFEKADSGSISISAVRSGYSMQDDCLIPWRTVLENLSFVKDDLSGGVYGMSGNEFISMMRLEEFADKYPSELSGGTKRRLTLARSLVTEPDLILLDEPFAFQDAAFKKVFTDFLISLLSKGVSIVLATHEDLLFSDGRCSVIKIDKPV